MRIEFTSQTTATVRRGLFRKRFALLHQNGYGGPWRFPDGTEVGGWMEHAMRRAQRRAYWSPIAALPRAEVVS